MKSMTSGILSPILILLSRICFSVNAVNAKDDNILQIATAANFNSTLQKISEKYHELHPDLEIKIIPGATANLYSQIINGALFDLFFSADAKHVDLLVEKNFATSNSSFVYASGRLCLLASSSKPTGINEKTLREKNFKFLAIAKPETAPYGFAAKEVLEKLALWDELKEKLVYAQDVGGVVSFVASGNVDSGFVALSQIISWKEKSGQNFWIVPQNLYSPIDQKVVALNGSKEKEAEKFLKFVKSSAVRNLIKESGYN